LIDPSPFFLTVPEVTEAAPQQLPSLFIYLLVIFAKAVAAQCVSELATKPTVADPIGILVMTIFTNPNFYWRGSSFINILVAKFRVACPTLFGVRGSEVTEEGRERLGWRKDVANNWYSEEEHFNRMAGLATGYAAISLRKVGENRVNPYPPCHYWTTIALIITTPDAQITQTQRVVLRGLVANHWSTFITLWGSMAVEALRLVIMDYPHRGTFDPTAGALYAMRDDIHNQMVLDDERKRQEMANNQRNYWGTKLA
jgi:nucleoporin GLE1